MAKYVVRGIGFNDYATAREVAIYRAWAQPGDGIPIWNRPYHAVAIIRHHDDTGDTLEHRLDRHGRELPGERVTDVA